MEEKPDVRVDPAYHETRQFKGRAASAVHFHLDAAYEGYRVLKLRRLMGMETGRAADEWRKRYPVKAMSPVALVEELLVLQRRDLGHLHYLDSVWNLMVVGLGPWDSQIRNCLAPPLRAAWGVVDGIRPNIIHRESAIKQLRRRLLEDPDPHLRRFSHKDLPFHDLRVRR
ncbi:uncharacterized protein BDV14DRAFT_195742 [Aspergillus stella-maris]|uniref:uncharacterized protein n=1 Tax=Aspergillus stella-maris TaxID=1810926 RepID=UPI003CCDAE3D